MGLSKNELIKKLKTISELCKRAMAIQEEMENFEPDDNYERKIEVPEFPLELNNDYDKKVCEVLVNDVDHTSDNAIEHMTKCYDAAYCPKKPEEPTIQKQPKKDTSRVDAHKEKRGLITIIAGFVGICSLISGGLFSGEILTVVLNLIIIAVCAVAVLMFFKKKNELMKEDEEATKNALKEFEQAQIMLKEKHKKDMEVYQNDIDSYKIQRDDFLEKYAKWRKIYLESVAEEDEIEEKLEKDRQAGVDEIKKEKFTPVVEELAKVNDLVSMEYLSAIDDITDLIKNGRADDVKEAINLYEDILYKERKLQLEREKEEQRQREEELRRQDEERRYQEDMQFRQQQERQRQKEAAESMNLQKQQHEENMKFQRQQQEQQERERTKQLREQREEENKQWNAAKMQCQACANAGRCSMSVYNRTPNCTGFRPR